MMPCFNIETYSAGVLRTKDMKIMTMKKRNYKVKDNCGENSVVSPVDTFQRLSVL